MSEFEDRLNSILNDPAQMDRITAMAKSLMGSGEAASEPPKAASVLEGLEAVEDRAAEAVRTISGHGWRP